MEKRHGKLQRLLAVLMSLMMALVLLAPSAFADETEKITINKPSTWDDKTSWAGLTVTAYQVFTQSNNAEKDNEKLYKVTEAFADFFNIGTVKAAFGKAAADGSGALQDVYLYYNNNTLNATNVAGEVVGTSIHLTAAAKKVDAIDDKYGEADLVSRITSTDPEGTITAQNGDIATFYTWIEKYIESNPALAYAGTATVDEANPDSVTINNLEKGYYALIFSKVPTGVSVIQGILVKNNEEVNLKAEEIPLTKQVKNPSTSHNGEDYSDNTTANVGDTLDYEITSQVPTLTDTENLTAFNLSDTMEKQMLTVGNNMTLTVGSATFTANIPAIPTGAQSATANFEDASHNVIAVLTVEPYNDTSKTQEFTVDFLQKKQGDALVANDTWTSYQGSDITLEYSAKLTADAYNINLNTITLTIDNNDDETTQTANTEVYTYGIDVEKTFSDGSTTENYGDVTFELRTAKDSGTISLVETGDGTYRKPAAGETIGLETSLKLNGANGKLTITGLDVGTYWLVETNAPDGYNEADPIRIVLTAATDTTSGKITGNLAEGTTKATMVSAVGSEKDLTVKIENQNTTQISLAKFEVLNQKGFNLPQTGGAGTWMFTVGGIVLIAAAGALFLASRKKRSSK